METINLESVAIFKAVVEEGGVVRAAATKLHRVPSNVTKRIRQLEEYLGVRLFKRQGRTSTSLRKVARSTTTLCACCALRIEAVHELRTGKAQGTFRLGALESTAGTRLAPILSRYHAEFPGVVVELVTGTTRRYNSSRNELRHRSRVCLPSHSPRQSSNLLRYSGRNWY